MHASIHLASQESAVPVLPEDETNGDELRPDCARPGAVVEIVSGAFKGEVGYVEFWTDDDVGIRNRKRRLRRVPWRSQLRQRADVSRVMENPQPGDSAYVYGDGFCGTAHVLAVDGEYADVDFHGSRRRCWIGAAAPVRLLVPAVAAIIPSDGFERTLSSRASVALGKILSSELF